MLYHSQFIQFFIAVFSEVGVSEILHKTRLETYKSNEPRYNLDGIWKVITYNCMGYDLTCINVLYRMHCRILTASGQSEAKNMQNLKPVVHLCDHLIWSYIGM